VDERLDTRHEERLVDGGNGLHHDLQTLAQHHKVRRLVVFAVRLVRVVAAEKLSVLVVAHLGEAHVEQRSEKGALVGREERV
jgi:hypothetical protein